MKKENKMKKMNKYIVLALSVMVLGATSCETTELDLIEDPNFLTPRQASPDLFLLSIQEDFVRQLDGDANGDPNDNFTTGGFQFGEWS